jgi:hypothetical protein
MYELFLLERSRLRPEEWLVSDKIADTVDVSDGLELAAEWMAEKGVKTLEAYNVHSEDDFGIMVTSPGIHFAVIIDKGVLVETSEQKEIFNGSLIVGHTEAIEA